MCKWENSRKVNKRAGQNRRAGGNFIFKILIGCRVLGTNCYHCMKRTEIKPKIDRYESL